MPSQTKEDYLKALYFLDKHEEKISLTALGQQMDLSLPSVNSMVKKLMEKDWVIYEKYQPLELTEKGRKAAAAIIRKHRLAEMFLVEKMGFGWEEVHDIAEQMEHIQSEIFFNRMDQLLGKPTHDPHGSPIPTTEGVMPEQSDKSLSEASIGDTLEVMGLKSSEKDFLLFLNKKGIQLGSVLKLLEIESFDGTRTFDFKGQELTLSEKVCEKIYVNLMIE